MLRLYHYGSLSPDASGKLFVDPARFGGNRHSAAEVRAGGPRRSFFYTGEGREGFFAQTRRRYVTDVDEKHVYDAVTDPEKLLATHGPIGMMHEAKRRGYRGVRYPFDPLPPVVAMWHPTEVREDMEYRPPQAAPSKLLFARKAPAGGMVTNNIFAKGGRFVANPLAKVSAVMAKLRGRVQLSRATAGNPEIQALAAKYRERYGLTHSIPHTETWSRPHADHMAGVYDSMVSDPHHPDVHAAYRALAHEVRQQHDFLREHGYHPEHVERDGQYPTSAAMFHDLATKKSSQVNKTTPDQAHPLLSNEENDQLRFVHDVFGHAAHGHQFGPRGEENAYRDHASMFSPLALRALATETRGQNSYLNAGKNAPLPLRERQYAPQKAALWPEHLMGEYHTMPVTTKLSRALRLARAGKLIPTLPKMHAAHQDAFPFEALDAGSFKAPTHAKIDSAVDAALSDHPKSMLPGKTELIGLADFGKPVKGGYADAGAMMEHMLPHPKDAMRWAAANAILSPQEGWVNHTEAAAHALALWHASGKRTDAAYLHHLFGGEGKPSVFYDGLPAQGLPTTYTSAKRLAPPKYDKVKAQKLRALFSIHDDDFHFDPRIVASGSYKTPNFFAAHFDPRGVPIDTHMAKLLRVAHMAPGSEGFLKAQKKLVGTDWVAHAYKALVSHTARDIGWEPRQVQEAVWTATIAIMLAKRHGAGGDFASLASKLHDRAIRAGWDMHTVFQSPTFVGALHAIGVSGDKINAARAASRERHPIPEKVHPTSIFPGRVESAAARMPADKVKAAYPIADALRLGRHTSRIANFDALLHLALLATIS